MQDLQDTETHETTRRHFLRTWGGISALAGLGAAAAVLAARALGRGAATVPGGRAPPAPPVAGSGLPQAFAYSIEPLKVVDPALLTYAEERAWATGFTLARRMALASGGGWLVAGDRSIRIFTSEGERVRELALSGEARCVAACPTGKVYAGLKDHVEVFDARGERTAEWERLGPRAHLTAIAAGPEAVYLADSGQRVVHACDLAGRARVLLAQPNAARKIPGLSVPSPYLAVAISPAGLLCVSNPGRHRIEAYTPAGGLERTWGQAGMRIEGFCGCCNPMAFAVLPDGGFVTSEKGLARVKVLDAEGQLAGVVAAPASFTGAAFGVDVAVDQEGGVYVLDGGTRSVRVFRKRKVAEHEKS